MCLYFRVQLICFACAYSWNLLGCVIALCASGLLCVVYFGFACMLHIIVCMWLGFRVIYGVFLLAGRLFFGYRFVDYAGWWHCFTKTFCACGLGLIKLFSCV